MNDLKIVFQTISIWVILLPLLTGSWLIKKLSHDSVIVFILVIIATPPQLLTAFLPLDSDILIFFYNIYTPLEFLLIFILFWKKFLSSVNKIIFILTGTVYLIVSTLIITEYKFNETFIGFWAGVNNITYIIWILMYVLEIFFFNEIKIDKKNPFTFFLMGLLIYSQSSMLLISLYNFISLNNILGNTWIIHSFGNITMYILFTLGFAIDKGTPKTKVRGIF